MHQNVCRLCLTKLSVCFSISEKNIALMLEALTSIPVTYDVRIPNVICLKCVLNLKLAYNFQQKAKESEEKLFEQIKIKQEYASDQDELSFIEEESDLIKLCNQKCIICGAVTDDLSINNHIRSHFNQEQKCEICNRSFKNFQVYKEHLLNHPEKTAYKCSTCLAWFQYKTFYDLHVKNVCGLKNIIEDVPNFSDRSKVKKRNRGRKSINSVMCSLSNDTIEQVNKLGVSSSKAIKVLSGDVVHVGDGYKECYICKKKVSKSQFSKHIEDHTCGPQICHLCGATLQNKNSLRTHIFYSHNEKRYKCEHCGKAFKKKHRLSAHIQRDHLGKPTHYCDTCGKGFFSLLFLNTHIKMKHLKLRPYICEFCKKGFSTKFALKTHRRRHTNERPYRCEVCGDGFKQNVSLRSHRKSIHNIIEKIIVYCKECGKGFASDAALQSHVRLH